MVMLCIIAAFAWTFGVYLFAPLIPRPHRPDTAAINVPSTVLSIAAGLLGIGASFMALILDAAPPLLLVMALAAPGAAARRPATAAVSAVLSAAAAALITLVMRDAAAFSAWPPFWWLLATLCWMQPLLVAVKCGVVGRRNP
jgi:hypothetical protein